MNAVSVPNVLGLAVLLLALPALSLAQLSSLRHAEIERVPMYVSSAITLLVLGSASLVLGLVRDGWAALGLDAAPGPRTLAWSAALTLAGLVVMFGFRAVARAFHIQESPLLRALLPQTLAEKRAFVVLSFAAGVGEELAYRGYTVTLLSEVVGPAVAVVVSAAAFGVMHAYQGAIGAVRTTLLGVLLGWGFLASGSLWPPMLAHAALDVLAGVILARWLVVPDLPIGVAENEGASPPAP